MDLQIILDEYLNINVTIQTIAFKDFLQDIHFPKDFEIQGESVRLRKEVKIRRSDIIKPFDIVGVMRISKGETKAFMLKDDIESEVAKHGNTQRANYSDELRAYRNNPLEFDVLNVALRYFNSLEELIQAINEHPTI